MNKAIKEIEEFEKPERIADIEETEELEILEEESIELYPRFTCIADKGQGLIRIDKFLSEKIENSSRSKIQLAAENNCILANGKPVKSNYRVKPLDVLTLMLPSPARDTELLPEDIPLEIIYEDNDVMVINKPPGMVVHPGHGNYNGTLVNALMFYLKDNPLFAKGDVRAGLVHRIDKNTSGLLIIAKTEYSHTKLAKQFFDHSIERVYHALVWGVPKEKEARIEGHIGRSLKNRLKMSVFVDGSNGKSAATNYKVIRDYSYVSLVECRLETGRTHQIRAHFEHLGHPLFNDERYGGDDVLRGTTFTKYKQFIKNCFELTLGHVLHAKTLGFTHPVTGERLSFSVDYPLGMKELLEKWEGYIYFRETSEEE